MNFFYLFVLMLSLQNFIFANSPYPDRLRDYEPPPHLPKTSRMGQQDINILKARCAVSPPAWMVEYVQKELAPFKQVPISLNGLKVTYEKANTYGYPINTYLWRYCIVGEKIYRYGKQEDETDLILRTLARLADSPMVYDLPPAADFILCLLDGIPVPWEPNDYWITKNREDQAPILCAWKNVSAPYTISVPQRGVPSTWGDLSNDIFNANEKYPWETKIKKACWRGNVSDLWLPDYQKKTKTLTKNYSKRPRFLASKISSKYPDLVDAGFVPSTTPELLEFIKPYTKNYLAPQNQVQYSYLLLIDGYINAGSGGAGYEWRLASNSVVFKQDSPCVTWFENGLKPYVHYIPVHNNMDNLIDQVNWAREHDAECKKIGETATQWVKDNLTVEDLYFYWLYLLQEYAKCQNFTVEDLEKNVAEDPNWVRIR